MMKCDALSAASASMDPASTRGWLATTATGRPEAGQSDDHRRAEAGLDLEPVAVVDDTSMTLRMS